MVGENLCFIAVEVALELWREKKNCFWVVFIGISRYRNDVLCYFEI